MQVRTAVARGGGGYALGFGGFELRTCQDGFWGISAPERGRGEMKMRCENGCRVR